MAQVIHHRKHLIHAILLGITTFCLYTFMYAVRKPFSALVYDHLLVWGVMLKFGWF